MGINGLSTFVKKRAEKMGAVYTGDLPLSELKGTSTAVDMNNLVSVFYSTAKKTVCDKTNLCVNLPSSDSVAILSVQNVVERLTLINNAGVTPVCCFDGKMNAKKSHVWEKRKKNRETVMTKYAVAEKALLDAPALMRSPALRKEFSKRYNQVYDSSLVREITVITKQVCEALGYPVITAGDETNSAVNPEAEALCAHLCLKGLCASAYSTDSDLYVYGANLCIKRIQMSNIQQPDGSIQRLPTFSFAVTGEILKILEMDHPQFVEFCIMCGTDYNPNIKRVGPVTSFKLITTHTDIPTVEAKTKHDTTILDRDEVLAMFRSADAESEIKAVDLNMKNTDISPELFESILYDIVTISDKKNSQTQMESIVDEVKRTSQALCASRTM
jgi:flap endonuclease-1